MTQSLVQNKIIPERHNLCEIIISGVIFRRRVAEVAVFYCTHTDYRRIVLSESRFLGVDAQLLPCNFEP